MSRWVLEENSTDPSFLVAIGVRNNNLAMEKTNMKTIFVVVNILAIRALGGCNSEDNPSAPGSDPVIFVIELLARDWPEESSHMDVSLAMENPGQIPSFEANGEEVLYFSLHGDQIYGTLRIPLADTLEFTLRSMNREITRTIRVPRKPDMVVCNGTELVEYQPNILEPRCLP